MRDWTFWEWVAYGSLAVGAFCLAFDAALKNAPNMKARMPRVLTDPLWPFLPLFFLVLSTAILLARGLWFTDTRRAEISHEKSSAAVERPAAKEPTALVSPMPGPSAPPKLASEATERIFVGTTVTPRFLQSQVDGLTDLQIDTAMAPYTGKWMRLSGKVSTVTSMDYSSERTILLLFENDVRNGNAGMAFNSSWFDRLKILRRGDRVSVVGQIRIGKYGVSLESCEIVESAK